MIIKNSTIFENVKIIIPDIFYDYRGSNFEVFNKQKYSDLTDSNDIPLDFIQDSISVSHKNVLRGLHGDTKTWKIIQCFYGKIFFVIVDVYKHSPTFKKHETFLLSDENKIQILVPPSFVNGHLCLSDTCVFSYKMTNPYTEQKSQLSIRWDDPKLNIFWPIKNPILSERDVNIPKNNL